MTPTRDSFWPGLLAAVVLHGALLAWLVAAPPPKAPPRPRPPPTVVRLVARPRPPPAPAPAPGPPRPVEPKRFAVVDRARPAPSAPAPPAAQPAPAPSAAPAEPPRPRRFAVALDATSPGGGVAVPTTAGPTAARGDPDAPATAPVGDNTAFARAGPPADVTEVEKAPRLLRQPSDLEMRAAYPESARRDGLEGDVRVELLVDESGAVTQVRVVGGAGPFDEAAARVGRLHAFAPATRGGRAVPVWLPWTLKFRLDG